MKATIDVPDHIYREVKARSAREGRTVREVTIFLYSQWISKDEQQEKKLSKLERIRANSGIWKHLPGSTDELMRETRGDD
ncbi:MAG: hypothetical protein AAGC74_08410 [Verrucomicrobiota bacterium]